MRVGQGCRTTGSPALCTRTHVHQHAWGPWGCSGRESATKGGREGGRQLLKLETARWWGRNFQALPLDSD